MSIIFRRAVAAIAITAALGACTPLQVVTHTVTQTEARVPVGQYKLDPHHTSVTFNVDHFKYTRFTMRFDRVAGEIDWKEGGLDKLRGKIIGYIYFDGGYGLEPVPLLDQLARHADGKLPAGGAGHLGGRRNPRPGQPAHRNALHARGGQLEQICDLPSRYDVSP